VRIRPGKVAVWAGWTHHGKTAMLKQLMLYGIQHGEKPLIASMEEEVLDVWEDLGKMACGREDPSIREAKRFVEFIRAKLWLYDQQGPNRPAQDVRRHPVRGGRAEDHAGRCRLADDARRRS
jgi:hypothetical protein